MRCGLGSHFGKCLLQDGTAFPKTTQAHHDSVCPFYMVGCHPIANLENVREREREKKKRGLIYRREANTNYVSKSLCLNNQLLVRGQPW